MRTQHLPLALALLLAAAGLHSVQARPPARHAKAGRPARKPAPYHPRFKTAAEAETQTLERINQTRIHAGLEPLRRNDRLAEVARAYSRRMAEERFFEHTSPD